MLGLPHPLWRHAQCFELTTESTIRQICGAPGWQLALLLPAALPEVVMSVPITELLNRARAGDHGAGDLAFSSLYQELKRLAASSLRRENATLSATALVHEAYLKLIPEQLGALEDRSHFFRLAAKAMRQILVDHARARSAEKRGGDWIRTEITDGIGGPDHRFDLLAIDQALNRLGARDAQLVEIVEGYFFAGQTFEQIAAALGISDRSVRRGWETARLALLHDLDTAA